MNIADFRVFFMCSPCPNCLFSILSSFSFSEIFILTGEKN
ncbi:hypothetical protein B4146_0842 [Bacillus subtilis]|nr:hypothetical protein B4146_0842 [Bacillus subtilis]